MRKSRGYLRRKSSDLRRRSIIGCKIVIIKEFYSKNNSQVFEGDRIKQILNKQNTLKSEHLNQSQDLKCKSFDSRKRARTGYGKSHPSFRKTLQVKVNDQTILK